MNTFYLSVLLLSFETFFNNGKIQLLNYTSAEHLYKLCFVTF